MTEEECGFVCEAIHTCIATYLTTNFTCTLYDDANFEIGPPSFDFDGKMFVDLSMPFSVASYTLFANTLPQPSAQYTETIAKFQSVCEIICDDDYFCLGFAYDRINYICYFYAEADLINQVFNETQSFGFDLLVAHKRFDYEEETDIPETIDTPAYYMSELDLDQCKSVCRFDVNCVAIVHDTNSSDCRIMTTPNGDGTDAQLYLPQILDSNPRSQYAPANEPFRATNITESQFDTSITNELSECQIACDLNPKCVAFSFEQQKCTLHSQLVLLEGITSSTVYIGLSNPFRDGMVKIGTDHCLIPAKDVKTVGCYNLTANVYGYIAYNVSQFVSAIPDLAVCQRICDDNPSYPWIGENAYYGVSGRDCYCFDTLPDSEFLVGENCQAPIIQCSDNQAQECGGVGQITIGETHMPEPYDHVGQCKSKCFEDFDCIAFIANTVDKTCSYWGNKDFEPCPSPTPNEDLYIEVLEHFYSNAIEVVDGSTILLEQNDVEEEEACQDLCDYHEDCNAIAYNSTTFICYLLGGPRSLVADYDPFTTLSNARDVYLFTTMPGWCPSFPESQILSSFVDVLDFDNCKALCEHHRDCIAIFYSSGACDLYDDSLTPTNVGCAPTNGQLFLNYNVFEDIAKDYYLLPSNLCLAPRNLLNLAAAADAVFREVLSIWECEKLCTETDECKGIVVSDTGGIDLFCFGFSSVEIKSGSECAPTPSPSPLILSDLVQYTKAKFSREENCIISSAIPLASFDTKSKEECAVLCQNIETCIAYGSNVTSGACELFDTTRVEPCSSSPLYDLYTEYTDFAFTKLDSIPPSCLTDTNQIDVLSDVLTIELCRQFCDNLETCIALEYNDISNDCTLYSAASFTNVGCSIPSGTSYYYSYFDVVNPDRRRYKYTASDRCFNIGQIAQTNGVLDEDECACSCSLNNECFAYQFDPTPVECTLLTGSTMPETFDCSQQSEKAARFKTSTNPYRIVDLTCPRNFLDFNFANKEDFECMALCNVHPQCRYFVHGSIENYNTGGIGLKECKLYEAQEESLTACDSEDIKMTAYVNGRTFIDTKDPFGDPSTYASFQDLTYQDCAALCDTQDECRGFVHTFSTRRFPTLAASKMFEKKRLLARSSYNAVDHSGNTLARSFFYQAIGGKANTLGTASSPQKQQFIELESFGTTNQSYRIITNDDECIFGLDIEKMFTEERTKGTFIIPSYLDTILNDTWQENGSPIQITLPCNDTSSYLAPYLVGLDNPPSQYLDDEIMVIPNQDDWFKLQYPSNSKCLKYEKVDDGVLKEKTDSCDNGEEFTWVSESIQLKDANTGLCMGVANDLTVNMMSCIDETNRWRTMFYYVFATQHLVWDRTQGSSYEEMMCLRVPGSVNQAVVANCFGHESDNQYKFTLLDESNLPTQLVQVSTGLSAQALNTIVVADRRVLAAGTRVYFSSEPDPPIEFTRLTECKLNARLKSEPTKLEANTIPGSCLSENIDLVDCESNQAALFSYYYEGSSARIEFVNEPGKCLGRVEGSLSLAKVDCLFFSVSLGTSSLNLYAWWANVGDDREAFLYEDPFNPGVRSCLGVQSTNTMVSNLVELANNFTASNASGNFTLNTSLLRPKGSLVHVSCDVNPGKSFHWQSYNGKAEVSLAPDAIAQEIPDPKDFKIQLWEQSENGKASRDLLSAFNSFKTKIETSLGTLVGVTKIADGAFGRISSAGDKIGATIDQFDSVEKTFDKFGNILKPIEFFPYVGTIVKGAGLRRLCSMISNAMKPVEKNLDVVENAINRLIEPIDNLVGAALELYDACVRTIHNLERMINILIASAIESFVEDTTFFIVAVEQMKKLKKAIMQSNGLFGKLGTFLSPLTNMQRSIKKFVLDPISNMLRKLKPLLKFMGVLQFLIRIYEFKVCFGWPNFRWGTFCFKVWFVKICIPIPVLSFPKTCFSLEMIGKVLADLFNWLRSIPIIGWVINAIDSLVSAIIKGIFRVIGVRPPSFSLPSGFVNNILADIDFGINGMRGLILNFDGLGIGEVFNGFDFPDLPEDILNFNDDLFNLPDFGSLTDLQPLGVDLPSLDFDGMAVIEEVAELKNAFSQMTLGFKCAEFGEMEVPNPFFGTQDGVAPVIVPSCTRFGVDGIDPNAVSQTIRSQVETLLGSSTIRRLDGKSDVNLNELIRLRGSGRDLQVSTPVPTLSPITKAPTPSPTLPPTDPPYTLEWLYDANKPTVEGEFKFRFSMQKLVLDGIFVQGIDLPRRLLRMNPYFNSKYWREFRNGDLCVNADPLLLPEKVAKVLNPTILGLIKLAFCIKGDFGLSFHIPGPGENWDADNHISLVLEIGIMIKMDRFQLSDRRVTATEPNNINGVVALQGGNDEFEDSTNLKAFEILNCPLKYLPGFDQVAHENKIIRMRSNRLYQSMLNFKRCHDRAIRIEYTLWRKPVFHRCRVRLYHDLRRSVRYEDNLEAITWLGYTLRTLEIKNPLSNFFRNCGDEDKIREDISFWER